MANGRMLRFSFFRNEELAEVSMAGRLLFQGLWLLADREGRLEDRVRRIKADIFPYDDVDVEAELHSLVQHGFIQRYEVEGKRYIWVINFLKHQSINTHEAASVLPPPPGCTDMHMHADASTEMHPLSKVKVNRSEVEGEVVTSSAFSSNGYQKSSSSKRDSARGKPTTTTLFKNLSYAEQARWVADVPDDLQFSWTVNDRRTALESMLKWCKENGKPPSEMRYHKWLKDERNHIPENATEVEKLERILASVNKETGICSNGQTYTNNMDKLRAARREEKAARERDEHRRAWDEAELVYLESSNPNSSQ